MPKKKPELIVALDVSSLKEARDLLDCLKECVDIFKVGSQLFTACGPAVVRFIEARGKRVFLDLKYHDIPNTVKSATEAAVSLSVALQRSTDYFQRQKPKAAGLFMYTLHTSGGLEMMKASVEAGRKKAEEEGLAKPLAVGVTVLTSEQNGDNIQSLVLERALFAKQAGLDGVVASCHEAKIIKEKLGKNFIVVTPGIRPEGEDPGDQQRVATPRAAILNGSDYLVVGRPVIQAKDPLKVAKTILKEMEEAL